MAVEGKVLVGHWWGTVVDMMGGVAQRRLQRCGCNGWAAVAQLAARCPSPD
jgi:hypothetical protein